VPPAAHEYAWLRTLNLDPRTRAAAAFGTAVVQRDQEALMASAWAQLAGIRRLNGVMQQAQLAREIAGVSHRERLAALSAPAILTVVRPALARVGTADPSAPGTAALAAAMTTGVQSASFRTFHAWVADSAISAGAVSSAFQAVSRPGGTMAKRLFTPTEPARAEVVKRLNARRIAAAPSRQAPDKTVTPEIVSQHLAVQFGDKYVNVRLAAAAPDQFFTDMPGWALEWQYHNVAPPAPLALLAVRMNGDDRDYEPRAPRIPALGTTLRTRLNAEFRAAATRHQQYLLNGRNLIEPPAAPVSRDLEAMKRQLLIATDPDVTFQQRVKGRLTGAPQTLWSRRDPLDPVLASPRFPQPMSEPLRQLSPELILPGAEHVPPDTLAVLTPNHRFIESYLVGLNHEMTRELIWRSYPGDVTATCFRQFWRTTAAATAGAPPDCANGEDVKPIRQWRGLPLGGNACGASARTPLVVLLRTELLRRYPTANIYAVKAVLSGSTRVPGAVQVQPLFRGSLDPDIAYLGFALTEAQARGSGSGSDLGYYFVIEQHATAPVFGLAAQKSTGQPQRWRDLSWDDLPRVAANTPPTYVRMNVPVPLPVATENLFWGVNSSNIAGITQRTPVRVARHFSLILSASS
jgi:hypothetical protein